MSELGLAYALRIDASNATRLPSSATHEINTSAIGHTDCGCGWCASTDFLVCRVGEMARWSRRYHRDLSNAWGCDLSDYLLDCRRSLPHCLFRVDVRRMVRAMA